MTAGPKTVYQKYFIVEIPGSTPPLVKFYNIGKEGGVIFLEEFFKQKKSSIYQAEDML